MRFKKNIFIIKTSLLSVLVGVLASLFITTFLYALEIVSNYRDENLPIIYFLPLAGLIIVLLYHYFDKIAAQGNNLVIQKSIRPRGFLPFLMSPLIFITTILTHLFGGSAGREGVAVQLGASGSDYISRWLKLEAKEKKVLLIVGAGAGFGAAMNTPLAGAIFGMEVLRRSGLKFSYILQALIGSYSAYGISILLKAPHPDYITVTIENYLNFKVISIVLISSLLFGLSARIFIFLHLQIMKLYQKLNIHDFVRPLIGGSLLVVLYLWEGSYIYIGLGIETIQYAMENPVSFQVFLFKIIFTAMTLASGFKGGEFTPLVFIGVTLASFLSTQVGIPIELMTSLGFAAVFASASKTPIACSIMACEIFGFGILPLVLISCFIATIACGKASIYKNQIGQEAPSMASFNAK